MITTFRILIVVATFAVLGSSPDPCNSPEVFAPAQFDTIVAFDGNCPSCATAVYQQSIQNIWTIQPGGDNYRVLINVIQDTLTVEP